MSSYLCHKNKYENSKIKKYDGFLEKPIIYVKCE